MNEYIRQLEADVEHFEHQLADLNAQIDIIGTQLETRGAIPFSEKTPEERAWYGRARAAKNHLLRDQRAVKMDLRKARAKLHDARQPRPSQSMVDKFERLKASADRQQALVRILRKIVGETAFYQACAEAEEILAKDTSTQQTPAL